MLKHYMILTSIVVKMYKWAKGVEYIYIYIRVFLNAI